MRRRALLTFGGALLHGAGPQAQPAGRLRRLGFMRFGTPDRQDNLLRALADLGYREGHNISIDWRWVASPEQAQDAAAELVRSGVELILAADTPVAHAAARATRTIPIVLTGIADPVGSGLVHSLARPGGNITGVSRNLPALAGKKLELLKQAAPAITRIAFLGSASDPATRLFVDNTRDAGKLLGLPSISDFRSFPVAGGLLAYGPSGFAVTQRVAAHVDRILRGAKPSELPIEEPRTFELVINLKTAKALDLTLPQSLLLRADEVIE